MFSFATPAKSPAQTSSSALKHSGVDREAHGLQTSLTVKPLSGEEIEDVFSRLAKALRDTTVVQMLVFGSVSASAASMEAMRRQFGCIDWPVTWVEGGACDGRSISGVQVFGFTGGEVERISLDGRVVGSVFNDGFARHCILGGLGMILNPGSRAYQTRQTLGQLEKALGQAGFCFADTVRTWFFLENLLSWYDEFNRVRTEIYSSVKFRTGSLPASTGVGGRNPAGTALAVAAWAVQPLGDSALAEEVASPMQCPAPAYGSSFSRAMELSSSVSRQLLVSGTASIAPGGKTLWKADARQQVDLTMEVVEAILHSRGFSFSDLTRATAYFKHRADVQAFSKWCAAHNMGSMSVVTTQCDICRDDLLFEFEADAVQSLSVR